MSKQESSQVTEIRVLTRSRYISPLEQHLRGLRQQLGLSPQEFAAGCGINAATYEVLENRGTVSQKNATRIIDWLGENPQLEGNPHAEAAVTLLTIKNLYPRRRMDKEPDARNEARLKQLETDLVLPFEGTVIFRNRQPETEKQQKTEDQIWLDTLQFGDTLGAKIRLLRLGQYSSREEYAAEAEVSLNRYLEIEQNRRTPRIDTLNKILAASSLPPEGKAAQALRLFSRGQKIMTVSDLQAASLHELLEYVRIAKGQTREEVASRMKFRSKTQVNVLFSGAQPPGRWKNDIMRWIDLPDESTMKDIVSRKIHSPETEIPFELVLRAQEEQFIFIPPPDNEMLVAAAGITEGSYVNNKLLRLKTFGKVLSAVRKRRHLTQESLAERIQDRNYSAALISRMERDLHTPYDHTALYLLARLGYDFHDASTQVLLRSLIQKGAVI